MSLITVNTQLHCNIQRALFSQVSLGESWSHLEKFRSHHQWSFRTTGTMGTLANQAEIGVWVQAPRPAGRLRSGGISQKNFWDCVCNILQSSAFLAGKWFAMPAVKWEQGVSMHSGSFWTMGMALPLEMIPVQRVLWLATQNVDGKVL